MTIYNAYAENTLTLDRDLCNGCWMCLMVCPHEVFAVGNKKIEIINKSACMECGACSKNCQTGAIKVNSGVGCATAMFIAALKGKKMEECSCG
jgi:ferredoxin